MREPRYRTKLDTVVRDRVLNVSPAAVRRRRKDVDRNVETILDAAIEVLGAQPHASMGDVAGAAGLSRQTVYAHFASRRQLVDATVSRALGRAVSRIDAAHPDDGAADEALRRVVETAWAFVAAHGALLHAARSELMAEVLHERHAPIRERVERLVRRGQADATFDRAFSADWLLDIFFALLHAAAEQRLQGRGDVDLADALGTTILKAFRPTEQAGGAPAPRPDRPRDVSADQG